MKTIFIILMFFTLNSFAQETILNWKILHPIKKTWIELGEKGSVQEALIVSGELPDPYYGLNEKKFDWIENYQWEFISRFYLSENQYNAQFLELNFPNIDTYADVYVNGKLVLKTENSFRPYSSQIRDLVHLGYNDIKVIFTPPILYHAEKYKNEKYHLPATNDVHPTINIAPYTRKPQYQFGWDWALRMNTIGFWKPIKIYAYNQNRIIGKNVIIRKISTSKAVVDFELFCATNVSQQLSLNSKLFGLQKQELLVEGNKIKFTVEIENPQLWWPRGQGEQYLYKDHWTLIDASNPKNVIDEIDVTFGVKKSELIIEPDKWGTSYTVNFNGRNIFCKGGDYIPQSIFPAQVKDYELVDMVDQMTQSNFNMIRVWGGGYYPDEAFYEACDRNGIMVWQDLMFACAMYPGDEPFLTNVKQEFEYQIPRIASHASLTLFNGNNEVDVAWKNWGFQNKYGIFGEDAKYIESSYDKLFKQLAPAVINSNSNAPYIHTSPLSNWGKDEYFNHGTMHYWGVWHGKDPIEDFGKKSGRFNAEYGFQSFPEFSTLATFSQKKDWNLDSTVMKHHQKSYVGNGMILKQAKRLYGEPKTFEEFVYFSQLTQAKAISIAIAGHRSGMPKCMGTLYWQINDCWQAPTWSSIDYFGNWKKLQYTVKDDYEDVAIVAKIQELGTEEFYLISDAPDSFRCEINYKIYNLKGNHSHEEKETFLLKQGTVQKICFPCDHKEVRNKNFVVHFQWKDANGISKERWFTHISHRREKAKNEEVIRKIISNDTLNKKIILEIENSEFVEDFWVTSTKLGLKYSTNFNDYLPGKHRIEISYSDDLKMEDLLFFWR